MPTAQSRANLKYYHKRAEEDPEYGARIAQKRMERYYANYEENKTKAREYQRARKEILRQKKIETA
jgi:hypothetical protein